MNVSQSLRSNYRRAHIYYSCNTSALQYNGILVTMGDRRQGQRGELAPSKCCKVFCALAVTVECSVFYFLDYLMVHLVVLARVIRATTKKVHPEKILNLSTAGKKILRAPMFVTICYRFLSQI